MYLYVYTYVYILYVCVYMYTQVLMHMLPWLAVCRDLTAGLIFAPAAFHATFEPSKESTWQASIHRALGFRFQSIAEPERV